MKHTEVSKTRLMLSGIDVLGRAASPGGKTIAPAAKHRRASVWALSRLRAGCLGLVSVLGEVSRVLPLPWG